MALTLYGNLADFRPGVDIQNGMGPIPQYVAAASCPAALTVGIKAGEIATLDNAAITNADTQIASTRPWGVR